MLARLFSNQIMLGAAQAAVAGALAVALMFLARARDIHIERETLVSLVRGLAQIVLVGSVLVFVLRGPLLIGLPILIFMMGAAGVTAARRARGIPGAGWVSFYGIAAGAGVVIVLMTFLGVIEWSLDSLIPVGSMLIANSMNTSALALDRFRSELVSHRGQVEAALALGATPRQAVSPYVVESVRSSLIPRVDSIRSLGIVWIPGLMAGMILSGTDPVYAALYQFVIMAMIYASSNLTSLVSTFLIRRQVFSQAHQLLLRK